MKSYTLDEVQNNLIGELGTPYRDKYEHELAFELNTFTSKDFNNLADNIEKTIALEFSNFKELIDNKEISYSSSDWTKRINTVLLNLGRQEGCLVASKLEEANNAEWLYDLVWYKNNSKSHGLETVLLIVESEWKNWKKGVNYYNEVKYDFEKLLLGRATHRLAIFEGNDQKEIQEIQKGLKNIISNSKITTLNDRFMFAAWTESKQRFSFDLYVH